MTFDNTVGSVQGRPLTLNTAGPGVQMQTVTLLLNSGGGGGSGSEGGAGWEGQTTVPAAFASPLICAGSSRLAMVVIVRLDNKHLFSVSKEGRVCFFFFFYVLNQFRSVLHTSLRSTIWYFLAHQFSTAHTHKLFLIICNLPVLLTEPWYEKEVVHFHCKNIIYPVL